MTDPRTTSADACAPLSLPRSSSYPPPVEPEHNQLWVVVAELDPCIGRSTDGETEIAVAACATREVALSVIDEMMEAGQWGEFAADDDPPISDTGWGFGLSAVPLSGATGEQVHLVFAEFDGSTGGTADGEYFVALKCFSNIDDAQRFADECRASGGWGQFDDDPCSSIGWYIGIETLKLHTPSMS